MNRSLILGAVVSLAGFTTLATSASAQVTAVELSAGYSSSCARFSNGKIKCWGQNDYGQLGFGDTSYRGDRPGTMGLALPYVDIGANVLAKKINVTNYSVCALTTSGETKCWGYNRLGSLALGHAMNIGDGSAEMGDSLKSAELGSAGKAMQMDGTGFHSCAVFETGRVKCWGYNVDGQLGLGDRRDRGVRPEQIGENLPEVDLGAVPRVMKVTTGTYHSCALFENGRVKCWGDNTSGALGLGDTQDRGDQAGEMGDALPFVDLGPDELAIDITAGYSFTCALLKTRKVKCWGINLEGQLGLGDVSTRGDQPGEMGANLATVDLGVGMTVMAVAAGLRHVCAVLLNGTMKCWGENRSGQLGLGDTNLRGDNDQEMGDALEPLYFGRNMRVQTFALGSQHGCAVLTMMGKYMGVKCWGANYSGQLGLEHRNNMGARPEDMIKLPFLSLGTDGNP
ncbi:MAG TPA: hypothetical protein VFV50_10805 [Bdellovibrionales bacterium]|nr:hypothetical protein [Bdellovibrionales bacterium]